MKPFSFDAESVASQFKENGYVHVKDGVNAEFFAFVQQQLARYASSGQNELPESAIKNKKRQYLLSLPDDDSFLVELKSSIAALIDKPSAQITLSERHIKIYEDSAAPMPLLHKDCVASQVAVGIPLAQTVDARLVLLAGAAREVNPLSTAVYGAKAVRAGNGSMSAQLLEDGSCRPRDLVNTELLVLDVRPRDVIIFSGSSIYHERFNGAGSAVLYLKFNAMGLDFLGEDVPTPWQHEQALKLLRRRSDRELLQGVIQVSPRLQGITRDYTRWNWTTVLSAHVAGRAAFTISENDLEFLTSLRGRSTVAQSLLQLGVFEAELPARAARIRQLAELGAVDFSDPGCEDRERTAH